MEFHGFEIIHLNGLDSRLEVMKVDQRNDEAFSKVIEYVKNGWPSYLFSTDIDATILQLTSYFDYQQRDLDARNSTGYSTCLENAGATGFYTEVI